jgi:ABC-type Fe3+/spermidine/putrescine transport system ATPase subunit
VAEFLGETNLFPGSVVSHEGGDRYRTKVNGTELVWQGSSQENLAIGTKVFCCIRPESWRWDDDPTTSGLPASNRLPGRMTSSVFLGETTQLTLSPDLSGLPAVKILTMCPPDNLPLINMRTLVLTVDPDKTMLLKG